VHGEFAGVDGVGPLRGNGLDAVRSRLLVRRGRAGVEADRELLTGALYLVDDDVIGVAVDPGDTGQFDRDA